uniref:Putative 8 kDa amblyomma family n=1 Tax=Rhipicephalus pulchellus TaxID=72859 RepID=L7MCH8_RHIPC
MSGFMALTIVMFTLTLITTNMGARVTPVTPRQKLALTAMCSTRRPCSFSNVGSKQGCPPGCRCSVSSISKRRNTVKSVCTPINVY